MTMQSYKEAYAEWKSLVEELKLDQDDYPMMAESWNDFTDSLGWPDLVYHYCPAWDDPGLADMDLADTVDHVMEGLKVVGVFDGTPKFFIDGLEFKGPSRIHDWEDLFTELADVGATGFTEKGQDIVLTALFVNLSPADIGRVATLIEDLA